MCVLQEVHSKLAALEETDGPAATVRDCTLEKPTQALVKLLFDNDMFNDAMKSMDIGEGVRSEGGGGRGIECFLVLYRH